MINQKRLSCGINYDIHNDIDNTREDKQRRIRLSFSIKSKCIYNIIDTRDLNLNLNHVLGFLFCTRGGHSPDPPPLGPGLSPGGQSVAHQTGLPDVSGLLHILNPVRVA